MADAIVRMCTCPREEWASRSDIAYGIAHGYGWREAAQRLLGFLECGSSAAALAQRAV
jgi:hypothetical protein